MCRPSQTPHLTMSSTRIVPRRTFKPKRGTFIPAPPHRISKKTIKVVVFQRRQSSHLCYTLYVFSQCQTRVKLNKAVFSPLLCLTPSPSCRFCLSVVVES